MVLSPDLIVLSHGGGDKLGRGVRVCCFMASGEAECGVISSSRPDEDEDVDRSHRRGGHGGGGRRGERRGPQGNWERRTYYERNWCVSSSPFPEGLLGLLLAASSSHG